MKKLFLFALATAVMSFAGCQEKEQEAPVNPNEGGSTFELVADIAQTKTTLDVDNGYRVDWEEGDVIYMVTSDGTWGKPHSEDSKAETVAEFTYAEGKFTSEATIADRDYTFNAIYARANQKTWHRAAGTTHNLLSEQVQNCNNPTIHIKENDALVGTFTATTPMAEPAKVSMSHIYTLMQVNVTNATGAAVEVKKFEMTAAGADLAGIFNVTAFDTPALTTKQNATSTITVNVTGGSVENNASLPVYFVMAPLSNYAGDITFKVTDSEGKTYTKTVTKDGISFEAGKYNTTPYKITAADIVEPEPEQPSGVVTATLTFDDKAKRTEYTTSTQVWEENGIKLTNNKGKSTSNVADYAKPARFYKSSEIIVEAPGNIKEIIFDCNSNSYANDMGNSISSGATVDSDMVTVSVDGDSKTFTIATLAGQVRVDAITVTYGDADPNAPSITVSDVKDVSARGVENAELTYEITNLEFGDLTITCDKSVVTSVSKGDDGVINYTVSQNATSAVRVGYIIITNGTITKNVEVSQNAPTFKIARASVELKAIAEESTTTVMVTSDFDWALTFTGEDYTVTPDNYIWTEGGKQQITIKALNNRTEEGVADLGTITIVNSTTGQELTIEVTQATSYVSQESETVTMNIYANKGTLSGKSISWTQNGFTVTNNQASSSNAIRTSDSDHFRLYANSELIFTSSSKKFNKVVVTCTGSSYATVLQKSASSAGLTATVSGSVVTISTSNPTTAMPTITMSAQSRINKVVVELN